MKLSNSPLKILIVDDEADLLDTMAQVLELDDHTVFRALNAYEAFKIIENEKLDLVISDIRMPNEDGMELLKKIKAQYPNSPKVILYSGQSDYTEKSVLESGAIALMNKPIDFESLNKLMYQSIKGDRN